MSLEWSERVTLKLLGLYHHKHDCLWNRQWRRLRIDRDIARVKLS